MNTTLVDKINGANNGKEIISFLTDTVNKLNNGDWEESVKFKLTEISFHVSHWDKGLLLSELKNTNRINKMITTLNDLEITMDMRNYISQNQEFSDKKELSI